MFRLFEIVGKSTGIKAGKVGIREIGKSDNRAALSNKMK